MNGMPCPECYQYFDDGDDHINFHIELEREREASYASVEAAKQQYLCKTLFDKEVFRLDSEYPDK